MFIISEEEACMKSLSVKWGIIFLAVGLIVCYGKAWGADWKELAQASTGTFEYDAASVRPSSEGMVRVWIHNSTKHETSLIEINCKGKSYQLLDLIEYNDSGQIQNRYLYYDTPPSWVNISSETVAESLYGAVCR
jgi:hypothetical protein